MPVNLTQLVYTVVAGSSHDLSAGSLYLIGFYLGCFEPPSTILAHGQSTTTSTTAEIFSTTGVEIYIIHNAASQHDSWFLDVVAAPGLITRIMVGHTFLINAAVKVDSPRLDVLGYNLDKRFYPQI